MAEVLVAYMDHAQKHYRNTDGNPSDEVRHLPWKERKELFGQFAAVTGEKGWSLARPFDELTGEDTKAAVAAAKKAKASGIGTLTAKSEACS